MFAAPAAEANTESATGKYVVLVKDGISPVEQAHSMGLRPNKTFDAAVHGYATVLSSADRSKLARDSDVLMVAPDRKFSLGGKFRPTHVKGMGLRPADNGEITPITGFPQGVPPNLKRVGLGQGLSTPNAQGHGFKVNVGVAVIDSGIESANPELNVAGGTNCSGDSDPTHEDLFGHGTEVSGVLAAKDNSYGIVGVAPGAPLYAVRVVDTSGDIETSSLICGLDYVAANRNKIKVANISIVGEGAPEDHTCGLSNNDPLHTAVCKVVAAGITVAVAAGNDGRDVDGQVGQANSGVVPADYPEVITTTGYADTDGKPGAQGGPCVDGTDFGDDAFAPFSNYGRASDVAAVATCVYTTYPDDSLVVDNGTSFAAPAVAGAAALIYSGIPDITPVEVHKYLERIPGGLPIVAGLTPNPHLAQLLIEATADHHPIPNDPNHPNEGLLSLLTF